MKFPFDPFCLTTAVGSMPHTDPGEAWAVVRRFLPDLPAWPQLPRRAFQETMYAQFALGLPGLKMGGERLYIDTTCDFDDELERLQADSEQGRSAFYAMAPETATGLYVFLATPPSSPRLVKGHITGPVSMALTVTDQELRPLIYHDLLSDAIAHHLRLRAAWQEEKLREVCPRTMLWVDEPYMSAFGSGYLALSKEKVVSLLETVLGGIQGIRGVHCCGNTDWSVLLSTPIDVLDYDAYGYGETLSLYIDEVKAFLGRGGVIGWGIVPNQEESLAKESSASLLDRLEETMAPFTRKGVPFPQLIRQGLLTPSCGLTPLSPEGAALALEMLTSLSERIRKRYGG